MQDTGWIPVSEDHASFASNRSVFVPCFSNKTSCVSDAVRPHTQLLTNVGSQVLHATWWSVRVPWPSVLFFLSHVPEAQLLYTLSSPSEHSIPPCGHIHSCSPGMLLFSYSATKCNRHRYSSRSQIKPHICIWQSPKAEKHQQPPKDNKWLVIIWKGTENKTEGFLLLSKTTLHPYPVYCTQFLSLQLKDIVELEKALEKDTKKA